MAFEDRATLFTVQEVAAQLKVSPSTVYALCAKGELQHVRVANAIRVSADDLGRFLRR